MTSDVVPARRHRRRAALALAMAGVLAVSACGGGGGGGGAAAPTINPSNFGQAGSTQDASVTGPMTIPGAQKGGTVTVLSAGASNTFDPSNIYETDTSSIFSGLIGRSLTQFKYDTATKQMVLVPDLATNLGIHNADFTSWSFTIRSGVKWAENGQPITAQDVAYGIERSLDRKTFNQGPAYGNEYFLGAKDYAGYTSGKPFSGLSVKGDTITIKMAKPFPDMPYYASFPEMGPVPKGHDNPTTYPTHPWSTGPYMVKSIVPGRSISLVRNPYWSAATDPGRTQYPAAYNFELQTPSNKIDAIMETPNNGGSTTLTYDNILANDYRTFDKSRLVTGGQPCTYFWAFDMRKITDLQVRQAVAYAYPYQQGALAGGAIDGVTIIRNAGENTMTPGTPGRVKYNVLGDTPDTQDIAKAHALLEAAHAIGYKLSWYYLSDSPQSVQATKVREAAFKQAGFDPEPIASSEGKIVQDDNNVNGPVNLHSGEGWCADWPSGATWIPPLFQTTDLKNVGFEYNYSAFSDKTVDSDITKIQTEPAAQQPASWNSLDKTITEKYLPIMVTGYGGVAMMRGQSIEGMGDNNLFGMPTWDTIWVKP